MATTSHATVCKSDVLIELDAARAFLVETCFACDAELLLLVKELRLDAWTGVCACLLFLARLFLARSLRPVAACFRSLVAAGCCSFCLRQGRVCYTRFRSLVPLVLSAARPRASHVFAPSLRQGAACILFAARARASAVDCARRACFVVDAGFLAAAGGAAAAQGGCGSRVTGRYACSEKYDFLIHHAAMPRAIDKGTSISDICKLYME